MAEVDNTQPTTVSRWLLLK